MSEEIFDIVNDRGEVIGSARRSEAHGNNKLLHRVVHVFVFDPAGRLLLQKRSMQKDVAPGKWDTSVGGHVDHGETVEQAVLREMKEELGIDSDVDPQFMYTYIHSNSYESEMVYSYKVVYDGDIVFNRDEIDKIAFWEVDSIGDNMTKDLFSDNFKDEFTRYKKQLSRKPFL